MTLHTSSKKTCILPWARAWTFFFAVVAACFVASGDSRADETRISVGYGTVDLHSVVLDLQIEDNPVALDGKGYWLRVMGDEGDYLYSLSFGRHSASGDGIISPSPPEIPIALDLDLKYPEIETVDAALGWHGLNLGELGFGPFIAYERVARSEGTAAFASITDSLSDVSKEQTVAGVLMRAEADNFDISATAGSIVNGNAWEHGLTMSIAADVHVSNAVTVTGDWTRIWGKQAFSSLDERLETTNVIRETKADTFGLGGRVRVADRAFLEGWITRARNGTNIHFGQENWKTTLNIGVGTSF